MAEIIKSSFTVANRISEVKISKSNLFDQSYAKATNVAKPAQISRKGCQLCVSINSSEAENHKIFSCSRFNSPISKLSKIKELNGCTRCGLLNHTVSGCNYKFASRCGNCNSWHAFFLCVKESGDSRVTSEKFKKKKSFS